MIPLIENKNYLIIDFTVLNHLQMSKLRIEYLGRKIYHKDEGQINNETFRYYDDFSASWPWLLRLIMNLKFEKHSGERFSTLDQFVPRANWFCIFLFVLLILWFYRRLNRWQLKTVLIKLLPSILQTILGLRNPK